MKTLHFIYAVPDSTNPFLYRFDKYARKTGLYSPSYRYGKNALISWPKPVLAPFSITYNLLNALRKKFKVRLYSHKESISVKMGSEDILLFYPPADSKDNPWIKPDSEKIGFKMFNLNKNNKSYIITPYNNDPEQVAYYKSLIQNRDVKFIAICGKFWLDHWEKSPLKNFLGEEDLLQVNMAIDSKDYPTIKTRFNKKGQRKFLYIGNTKEWKNTKQLESLSKKLENFQGGYISDGEISGWKKISGWRDLNFNFMKQVAEEYDIFLNCSIYDAQATTVLEQMSYGFPIACTPESGHSLNSVIKLDRYDTDYNCLQLNKMQYMEEEELRSICLMNKALVEENHNWNQFTEKILTFIEG